MTDCYIDFSLTKVNGDLISLCSAGSQKGNDDVSSSLINFMPHSTRNECCRSRGYACSRGCGGGGDAGFRNAAFDCRVALSFSNDKVFT